MEYEEAGGSLVFRVDWRFSMRQQFGSCARACHVDLSYQDHQWLSNEWHHVAPKQNVSRGWLQQGWEGVSTGLPTMKRQPRKWIMKRERIVRIIDAQSQKTTTFKMFCFVWLKQRLTIQWAVQSTETRAYSVVSGGQMVRSPAQTMVSGKVWCIASPDDSILPTRWTQSILLVISSDHRQYHTWSCMTSHSIGENLHEIHHHKDNIICQTYKNQCISADSSSEHILIQMNVRTINMSGRTVAITCCDVQTCATCVRPCFKAQGPGAMTWSKLGRVPKYS